MTSALSPAGLPDICDKRYVSTHLKDTEKGRDQSFLSSKAGFFFRVFGAALLCLMTIFCGASEIVRYPLVPGHTQEIEEQGIFVQALQLAFRKAGADYVVIPSKVGMLHERSLRELERGTGVVHVIWSYSTTELEARLLPIRVSIDKGLFGWRLLFVRKVDLAKFAKIVTLKDFTELKTVQGHDWPDKKILEANGLSTHDALHVQNMFSMLQLGRVDYFPRSIVEIWEEQNNRQAADVVVEPTLLLHYPSTIYFWVNKKNTSLHQVLTKGLETALRDGSLDELFDRHYGASLAKANLTGRKIIELNNPFHSRLVQQDRKEILLKRE